MSIVYSELAQRLKEIGFNRKTPNAYYVNEDGYAVYSSSYESCEKGVQEVGVGEVLAAPTYGEAIEWFREEKGIMISIIPTMGVDDNLEDAIVFDYKLYSINREVKLLETGTTNETIFQSVQCKLLELAIAYATNIGPAYLNLRINDLDRAFPDFVWWRNGSEICGINFTTKQLITIEDGTCRSKDGKWLVHGYQFNEIPTDWKRYKYPSEEMAEKIIEEQRQLVVNS